MASPDPQQQVTQLMQAGLAALKAGRASEAAQHLGQAVRRGVDTAPIWLAYAMATCDSGDLDTADRAADRSIALEPRNPRARFIKGDVNRARGDERAAAAFYNDGLGQCPPPEQCPVELTEDMRRVEAILQALRKGFIDHIDAALEAAMTAAGPAADRFRDSVDMMVGRKKNYLPQPHQYYFPGLPVREFYAASEFDWVPELEAATDDIRSELDALLQAGADFDAYVTGDENRPVYDTHGMSGNDSWGAFYLWHNGKAVAENQARCPKTTAALEKVPLVFSGRRSPNVLFSRLKPGATIPPHTGMVNTRLIGHLPLIVPDNCGFRVGNDRRSWVPGKVWLFDDTIEHEAWNRSGEERIILLFEVWKPELSTLEHELLTQVFAAVDAYQDSQG